MTMRQVVIALEKIDVRTHNDIAVQAKFHGFKMAFKQPTSSKPKFEELSEDDRKRADEAMKKAIERKAWRQKN